MSTSDRTPREFDDRTIVFHFNVKRHSLPLRQFVDTAEATQSILDNFNKELWGGKVKFELRVVAPQSGGLIEIIEIVFPYALPAWFVFEIGKGIIKGLLGHEPCDLGKKAGKRLRGIVLDEDKNDKSPPDHLHYMPREQMERELPIFESTDVPEEKQKEKAASIMAKACVGFLETSPDRLEEMGFSKEKYRKAYEAKNQVYKACINNPEVRGLGFDHSHSFKFEKKDFAQQITDFHTETDEMKAQEEWKVEVVDIFVNSPNWDREGKKRKWQGRAKEHKKGYTNVSFSIEDEVFWDCVDKKTIEAELGDDMRVQWVYKIGERKLYGIKVLRVLTYNGDKISDPLNEEELREELGDVLIKEDKQLDFFDIASEKQARIRKEDTRRDEEW